MTYSAYKYDTKFPPFSISCCSILNLYGETQEVPASVSQFSDRVLRPVILSNQSSFRPTCAFDFHSQPCLSKSWFSSSTAIKTGGSSAGTKREQFKRLGSMTAVAEQKMHAS